MAKLEITICTGTTCYVMGAGRLLTLAESLDPASAAQVHVRGASCLGLCKDGRHGKAPFVQVGDTLVSEATLESVRHTVDEVLQAR